MQRSLVGSEMCIRDRLCTLRGIDENNEFEPKRKGNKLSLIHI
ncbi:hypothetical protein JMUB7514_27930 [Staphylococcus aureus]